MPVPFRLDDEAALASLRGLLTSCGYTAEAVAERYGLPGLYDWQEDTDREPLDRDDTSPLAAVCRLFLEGRYAPEDDARAAMGDDTFDALLRLGVLASDPDSSGRLYATVALYPVDGLHIASDRWNQPDRSLMLVNRDVVYSAIVANTHSFLKFIPTSPCGDFLELCSGTGVAALGAARDFARHAYAYDITERSTLFAEFNRRLNGLDNVTAAEGDLYDPAGEATFDRIVAHPPYVPVVREKWVFHSGGEDGEFISRRIVEGLPRYLRPGGLFYMLSIVTERQDGEPDARLRAFLGEAGGEFDVAFLPIKHMPPETFALNAVKESPTPSEDLRQFKEVFERLRIRSLVQGMTFIQRRSSPRAVFTVRRQHTAATSPADVERLLDLETAMTTREGLESLLDRTARANASVRLTVSHAFTPDGWQPDRYQLVTEQPFSMQAATDAWAPYLLSLCDGRRTLRAIFAQMQEDGVFPAEADPIEFAQAAGVLASGSLLFLD